MADLATPKPVAPAGLRISDARRLAADLLEHLPERWRHTVGVAHRADELIDTIGSDDPVALVSAAWLHDIGYAAALADTGMHALDGARFLERTGWPERIVALVAHHSGSRFVAEDLGHAAELAAYRVEKSALSDALTYADQTTAPDGHPMSVAERSADMLRRHGPTSPNARVHDRRGPYLLAVADRVEHRLARTAAARGRSER